MAGSVSQFIALKSVRDYKGQEQGEEASSNIRENHTDQKSTITIILVG